MSPDPEHPRLFLLDADRLLATRRRVYEGDPLLGPADQRLLEDVEAAVSLGPFTVVDKASVPPSGDRHDYLSQAPYWWPDPDTADGLPYVRRDGEANPDRELHDRQAMAALLSAVHTLAPAFFYSDHERFAERAGLLLRTWFLDPATRMNPHLQYAQGIPGRCDERGIGIIDTLQLATLVDAVGLLQGSAAWSVEDHEGLTEWMAQYLAWLVDSDHGRDEARQRNDHGTWYDVQVLALALFTENEDLAQRVAAGAPARLDSQIEADGSQPLELARTRSLGYSVMNLLGFFDLADLAVHAGVDLWGHEGDGGRSLRRALDWLVANALESEWLRPQITPFESVRWIPLLRRAALRFDGGEAYETRLAQLRDVDTETLVSDRTQLLYASPFAAA